MLIKDTPFSLGPWLHEAFRGELPEEVAQLFAHRETTENVMTEMMTQWPASVREPMEHLHQMHKADTELMYAVMKNLFLRHLEGHPAKH